MHAFVLLFSYQIVFLQTMNKYFIKYYRIFIIVRSYVE